MKNDEKIQAILFATDQLTEELEELEYVANYELSKKELSLVAANKTYLNELYGTNKNPLKEIEYRSCFNCSVPKTSLFGFVVDAIDCPNGETIEAKYNAQFDIDPESEEGKKFMAERLIWVKSHSCSFWKERENGDDD